MSALDVGTAFLESTVRTATPLALAALGECVSERAGVINIGLEGSIIAGALGGTVAAGIVGVGGGFVAGALAGMAIAALFAWFAVGMRADQIITGTAITLFALGLTGTLYRSVFGAAGVALTTPTAGTFTIPGLASIPLLGPAFFSQPAVTYVAMAFAVVLAWWMRRTMRDSPCVRSASIPKPPCRGHRAPPHSGPRRALCGRHGGLAGATLVLAQAGTFVEGMSAGRGFIAIAIVVLGRWQPLGVAGAALLFGAANSLQTLFQSMGWSGVPYQLFLALPYVLTLLVLAGASGRSAAPAALGKRI